MYCFYVYYLFCDKYLKNQDTAKDTIHKISAIDCKSSSTSMYFYYFSTSNCNCLTIIDLAGPFSCLPPTIAVQIKQVYYEYVCGSLRASQQSTVSSNFSSMEQFSKK